MKKRRSIKGAQTPTPTPPPIDPNDIAPECIKVDKVYDWVFFANEYDSNNFIPDEECRTAVSNALAAGESVTTECNPPSPGDVVSRATILENGNPGKVQIIWTVPVEVTVLINDTPACTFTVRTQYSDTLMMCVPDGITDENLNTKVTEVKCTANGVLLGPDPFGPIIPLRVFLCKDIQVEFPVKLEVLGKFCFPRPNNIEVPSEEYKCDLNALEFPRQCPGIFPPDNCECQATVIGRNEPTLATFGEDGVVVSGTSTFEGEICQECSLADSMFTYSFTESDGPTPPPTPGPQDFDFTFDVTTFDEITCATDAEILTVSGVGVQTTDLGSQNVDYELTIDNTAGTINLLLTDGAGNLIVDTGTIDAFVRYEDCETFRDLLDLI